ncbi:MAG: hypothetical protein ACLGI2_12595 [Acidimicrobiia bacterium]
MLGHKGVGRLLAGLIALGTVIVLSAAPARAQTYVGVPPPNVAPSDTGPTRPAGPTAPAVLGVQSRLGQVGAGQLAQVRGSAQVRAQGTRLAVTGGDLLGMVALAGAALVIGVVLVRGGRRPRAASGSS